MKLAETLTREVPDYLRNFPVEDSEWRLFNASLDIIATASDQELRNHLTASKQAGLDVVPPWWILEQVPLPQKKRRKFSPLSSHCSGRKVTRAGWMGQLLVFSVLVIIFLTWELTTTTIATTTATTTTTTSTTRTTTATTAAA